MSDSVVFIVVIFSQPHKPVSFTEDQLLFEEDVFEVEKSIPILKVCKTLPSLFFNYLCVLNSSMSAVLMVLSIEMQTEPKDRALELQKCS